MIQSDEASWNYKLMGYATNGYGIEALHLFSDMRKVVDNETALAAVWEEQNTAALVAVGRGKKQPQLLSGRNKKQHSCCFGRETTSCLLGLTYRRSRSSWSTSDACRRLPPAATPAFYRTDGTGMDHFSAGLTHRFNLQPIFDCFSACSVRQQNSRYRLHRLHLLPPASIASSPLQSIVALISLLLATVAQLIAGSSTNSQSSQRTKTTLLSKDSQKLSDIETRQSESLTSDHPTSSSISSQKGISSRNAAAQCRIGTNKEKERVVSSSDSRRLSPCPVVKASQGMKIGKSLNGILPDR
ncbi:hypothetical protein Ccrd_005898 [Cynara cardunculus var. scolymus]|uniref:Pentatricopeptide repeat-containing protein n=1 Tax=Cynara cardunculus var. scolymus TaxID=59895 RepID=A0A103XJS5_CYNCS|nr:hypothetical protein Ccrd_005898 [Cynara cardunculus var. scolymus]